MSPCRLYAVIYSKFTFLCHLFKFYSAKSVNDFCWFDIKCHKLGVVFFLYIFIIIGNFLFYDLFFASFYLSTCVWNFSMTFQTLVHHIEIRLMSNLGISVEMSWEHETTCLLYVKSKFAWESILDAYYICTMSFFLLRFLKIKWRWKLPNSCNFSIGQLLMGG